MPKLLPAAMFLSFLIATPALAQDQSDKPPETPTTADQDGDSLMIGVGIGAVPSYEGSNDTALSIVPGIRGRVSRINFELAGNRFTADLIPTKGGPGWDLQLGPVAQLNFNRVFTIIDPQVKRLGKRDVAVEVGGYVGIGKQGVITSDYDKLSVSVIYAHDIAGSHKSYAITPSINYGTPLSRKAFVNLAFAADYMGEGYARTYFSVDAAGSAASGLPVFNAHKGWKDWTVAAIGNVSLTGDLTHGLSLLGLVSYRRMLGDAAATPITSIAGSPNQLMGVLGVAYTF